jgi:hypothetical protein
MFPSWIPCTSCSQPLKYHTDKKCPFDSTEFRPDETTVEMILGEMRYAEATSPSRGDDTWLLAVVTRRYLQAFEVVVDKLVDHIKFLEES